MIVKNIFFNTLSRLINLTSHFLFIPIYIKFLGIEGYGVIGIYIVFFTFLTFTDFGMTATITRLMALKDDSTETTRNKKTIFNTFEITYFSVMIVILLLSLIFLDPISSNFFNESDGVIQDKIFIFFLMIWSLFFQLPSSLYVGALMGLNRQQTANILMSTAALARGIFAILFLYINPSLESFFCSQILVNISYLIILKTSVQKSLTGTNTVKRFDIKVLKDNLTFTSNMALLSILGIILSNSDKLFIANLLSLRDIGLYTLAFNLSTLPIMICQIISVSSYPKIIEEVENFQALSFSKFYQGLNTLMATILIPLCLTLTFFNYHISYAWIGDMEISRDVYFYAVILVAAQTIQGSTMIAYYFALSRQVTLPQIVIALFSAVILLPVMYFSIIKYELLGASLVVFFCILISYPFGVIFLNRNKQKVSLYKHSVIPYLSTFLVLLPLFYLLSLIPYNPFESRFLNLLIIAIIFLLGTSLATAKNYIHIKDYLAPLKYILKKY